MPLSDLICTLVLIMAGIPVVYFDLKSHTIPNVISYAGIAVGLVVLLVFRRSEFMSFTLAFLLGFGVFFVFYLLGWVGGGDVKLMGMIGLLMGFDFLVSALVWISVAGGVIAIVCLILHAIREKGFSGIRTATIPYGTAIVSGSYYVLFQGLKGG
jgi:prepilin peptidase CpaA